MPLLQASMQRKYFFIITRNYSLVKIVFFTNCKIIFETDNILKLKKKQKVFRVYIFLNFRRICVLPFCSAVLYLFFFFFLIRFHKFMSSYTRAFLAIRDVVTAVVSFHRSHRETLRARISRTKKSERRNGTGPRMLPGRSARHSGEGLV